MKGLEPISQVTATMIKPFWIRKISRIATSTPRVSNRVSLEWDTLSAQAAVHQRWQFLIADDAE